MEEHRVKIANSKILNRLIAHHMGELELSQTQVNVGLALMKKVLPDLQAMQIAGDPDKPLKMVIEWENITE